MSLSFEEYAAEASKTAHFDNEDAEHQAARVYGIMYCALGLGGEAGEAQEKVKKLLRDDNGVLTDERRDAIESEVGDVLWYAAMLCREIGTTLEGAALNNIAKITSRRERNMVHGDGDTR